MCRSLLILALLSASTSSAKPAEKQKTPASTAEVKPVMAQFLANLQALQPYMTSEQAFASPANEAEIGRRLASLAKGARSLNHFEALSSPGFAVSAGVLGDHVRQTNAAFKRGQTEHARWLLNETMQACISCHAQLPSGATSLVVPVDQVKGSPLERADFLFATRQFDTALAAYNQIIMQFNPRLIARGASPFEPAESALKRELAIYLRVKRAPEMAAKALDRQQQNLLLPGNLRESMKVWVAELQKPGIAPTFDPKTVTATELRAYAHRILGDDLKQANLFGSPEKAASYLLLSGVLYEALQTRRADPSTPELLLWLAKCDRGLSRDFFLSMSDLYLQECVRAAPRTPIAKQCYREFEESITLQYTGSRGTDLPEDVQDLLSDLRSLTR